MRHETIVSKPQRKQCCWAAKYRVAAAFVTRRHQYRSERGRIIVNQAKIISFNERNVGWNDQRGLYPARCARISRHADRVSLAEVGIIADDIKPVVACDFESKGIAGHHRNVILTVSCSGAQNIFQHGVSELRSLSGIQQPCQALFGITQILYRNQDHFASARRAGGEAATCSAVCAMRVLSSEVRIRMLAQCTCRRSDLIASAAAESQSCATSTSRKSPYAPATPAIDASNP